MQHNEYNERFHSVAIAGVGIFHSIVGISQIYSLLQKEKTKGKNNILNIKNKIRYEILRTR